MFFGITMSPQGWLITIVIGLLAVFSPIFIIGNFADNFDEPIRTIIVILGSYVMMPLLVSYLYTHKIKQTGKGSAIFYIYFVMYILFFILTLSKLYSKGFSLENISGVVILGGVVFYMYKTIKKSKIEH